MLLEKGVSKHVCTALLISHIVRHIRKDVLFAKDYIIKMFDKHAAS